MLEKEFCECLFFTANRLNKIVSQIAEEELSQINMSPTYVYILLGVNFKNGITQKELSKELHLKPSTITRHIDKLVYNGLVERKMDGKLSRVYLTKSGEEIQEKIHKARIKLHNRYKEILGVDAYKNILELTNSSAKIFEDN
ncbi:MarR family winged helix-turn-helix transcriptional regulator, partial [Clostridium sp.]|uniref:MarR family winged helix-turn-helix transcriptional regulator n=1 Tax=Clostridium sp. TaxID=1506 RepID=UPI003F40EBAD